MLPRVAGIVIPSLLIFLLLGCQEPLAISDDAERDLDRNLPALDGVQDDITDTEFNYDTRPTWIWTGDSVEGTGVYRWRLNGAEWKILTCEPGEPCSYSPNGEGDLGRDLYPGTYLFEVEERNTAGNWSEACVKTTVIKVQPPVLTFTPPQLSNDAHPYFEWQTQDPPQYGNGIKGLYSWRVSRLSGSEWVMVPEHSESDQPVNYYYTSVPLTDGLYRFGAAERNAGGERSAFFRVSAPEVGDYVTFRIDTTPPNPPVITSPDLKGSAGDWYVTVTSPTFYLTSGGPDGTGFYDYELHVDGNPPVYGYTEEDIIMIWEDLSVGSTYTLYVAEYDHAYNISDWSVLVFTVRSEN